MSNRSSHVRVDWLTPAGVVPRLYWNKTIPLRDYDRASGNTSDMTSPSAGVVTRSDGQGVPGLTVSWTSESPSTTNNTGSDGDGADDRIERLEGSNPLLSTIRPTFAGGVDTTSISFRKSLISDQHRILDSQNRLIDRWATPPHFHALGGQKWELRSAGPDQKLWTEDDLMEPLPRSSGTN